MIALVRGLPVRLWDIRLLRYVLASAVALGFDLASFLILLGAGGKPILASAISYATGMLVHWLLSSRMVFSGFVADGGIARLTQKLQFALSALAGMAATMAIVASGQSLNVDPRIAKLVAVGVSFAVTWMLRRHLVFAAPINDPRR